MRSNLVTPKMDMSKYDVCLINNKKQSFNARVLRRYHVYKTFGANVFYVFFSWLGPLVHNYLASWTHHLSYYTRLTPVSTYHLSRDSIFFQFFSSPRSVNLNSRWK